MWSTGSRCSSQKERSENRKRRRSGALREQFSLRTALRPGFSVRSAKSWELTASIACWLRREAGYPTSRRSTLGARSVLRMKCDLDTEGEYQMAESNEPVQK